MQRVLPNMTKAETLNQHARKKSKNHLLLQRVQRILPYIVARHNLETPGKPRDILQFPHILILYFFKQPPRFGREVGEVARIQPEEKEEEKKKKQPQEQARR